MPSLGDGREAGVGERSGVGATVVSINHAITYAPDDQGGNAHPTKAAAAAICSGVNVVGSMGEAAGLWKLSAASSPGVRGKTSTIGCPSTSMPAALMRTILLRRLVSRTAISAAIQPPIEDPTTMTSR